LYKEDCLVSNIQDESTAMSYATMFSKLRVGDIFCFAPKTNKERFLMSSDEDGSKSKFATSLSDAYRLLDCGNVRPAARVYIFKQVENSE